VAYTALFELSRVGKFARDQLPAAIEALGIDPEASDPAKA
jgi:hypothetical protein